MADKKPRDTEEDALAREVDKLLLKLPGADPYLKGEPDRGRSSGAVATPSLASRVTGRRRPSRGQRIGVWVRAALGAVLGAVITQWPYGHACGLSLSLYLGAVTSVLVAGGWAAVWSWRYRLAAPHAVALAVIFWGAALAADQVLERVGYAAASAVWRCAG